MFFAHPARLKEAGIIGMNQRNHSLIARNNPRHLFPLVDDKLKTKKLLQEAGLPTPQLLGVVRTQGNVRQLGEFLVDKTSFAMKPTKGSGGKGILVIASRKDGDFVKTSGAVIDLMEIKRHASNTLSGLYSLGGTHDYAMIESMILFSDVFEGFSYQGIPDIRIILYKGYPVLSMTRLSTKESDGKANLHQGAVGVGMDILKGKALKAVSHDRPITFHPDTGKDLSKLEIPNWRDVLVLASRCFDIIPLGYMGVDIVLDIERGPQIIEMNARPGLAIQTANGFGLQPRIDRIDREDHLKRSCEQRVDFIHQIFESKVF